VVRIPGFEEYGGMETVNIEGKGTTEFSGGVLRLRWRPGVTVGIDEVNGALSAISTLGQGVRLPMRVRIQNGTHAAAARKVFPSPSTVARVALLDSSPVGRVVGMFRLPLIPVGFPIRYFTSEEKALAWLLEA
jgi:hypothetical protein